MMQVKITCLLFFLLIQPAISQDFPWSVKTKEAIDRNVLLDYRETYEEYIAIIGGKNVYQLYNRWHLIVGAKRDQLHLWKAARGEIIGNDCHGQRIEIRQKSDN